MRLPRTPSTCPSRRPRSGCSERAGAALERRTGSGLRSPANLFARVAFVLGDLKVEPAGALTRANKWPGSPYGLNLFGALTRRPALFCGARAGDVALRVGRCDGVDEAHLALRG